MNPFDDCFSLYFKQSPMPSGGLGDSHGVGLASAFSAEQKRAEEQLMETFDGVQALVHARSANMSLVVSESDDVLAEALEQEAKHVYQMIVIGNERKWTRTHQHVHHLNLHRHHLPHIRFGGSRRRGQSGYTNSSTEEAEGNLHQGQTDNSDDDDDGDFVNDDEGSVHFSDLVGSSTTSLLVVHPPLEAQESVQGSGWLPQWLSGGGQDRTGRRGDEVDDDEARQAGDMATDDEQDASNSKGLDVEQGRIDSKE
jgi:hypothetical protein